MKTIQDIINELNSVEAVENAVKNHYVSYPLYKHDGKIGILCYLPDSLLGDYTAFNSIAFVPVEDLKNLPAEVRIMEPLLTEEDSYGGYAYCSDIDIMECRNLENEERKLMGWWSLDWKKMEESDDRDNEERAVLVEYAANLCNSDKVAEVFGCEPTEELSNILCDFVREWEAAPCDPEGATPEQDAVLDSILGEYAERILNS